MKSGAILLEDLCQRGAEETTRGNMGAPSQGVQLLGFWKTMPMRPLTDRGFPHADLERHGFQGLAVPLYPCRHETLHLRAGPERIVRVATRSSGDADSPGRFVWTTPMHNPLAVPELGTA